MKFIIYISFILILFSCKKEPEINVQKKNKQEIINEQIDIDLSITSLLPESKKIIANWEEYQILSEFIPKFYKSSTKEVLFNSNQLETLTKLLKDSIRIEKFNIPSFKIRLNVLHNEALRLFDMDSISSITNKEIIHENKNILNAFNAINMKINSIVKKDILVNDLLEFDFLFDSNKNDSLTFQENEKKLTTKRKEIEEKKKRIQPLSKKRKSEAQNN